MQIFRLRILLFVFCLLGNIATVSSQQKAFYNTGGNIASLHQPKQLKISLDGTNRQERTLSSMISYSPINRLGIMLNSTVNRDNVRFGVGIGTYTTIYRDTTSNQMAYLDIYTGIEKSSVDLFHSDMQTNAYYVQLGLHHKKRLLSFSLLGRLNVFDTYNMNVFNLPNAQSIIDEINDSDPFIVPELKARITFNSNGVGAYIQGGSHIYRSSLIVDNQTTILLGICFDLQMFHKKFVGHRWVI